MRNQKVNHQYKVWVGNKVRSYDFPNRKDYYAEGFVTHVDPYGLVHIKTTKIRKGILVNNYNKTSEVTTTFPLTGVIFEYEGRIAHAV
jgi:hypothetical protein